MKAFGTRNKVVWVAALAAVMTTALAAGPGGNNDRHDTPPPAPRAPEPPRQPEIPRGPEPSHEQAPPPRAPEPPRQPEPPRAPEPRQPDIPRGPINQHEDKPASTPPPAPSQNWIPRGPNNPHEDKPAPSQNGIPRGPNNPHEDKPAPTPPPAPSQNWIPRGPINPPPAKDQHGHFQGGGQGQQNQQNQQNQQQNGRQQGRSNAGQSNWYDRYNRQSDNSSGRSGSSHYQSNNNQYQQQGQHPQRIGPPPVFRTTGSDIQYLRRHHDFTYIYGTGSRIGYTGYSNRWRDSFFSYPFYVFDPYDTFGFISPWYYYANLPGYIDPDRCVVIGSNLLPRGFVGAEYGYTQQDVQNAYSQGYQDGQQQQQSTQADNRILDGALDDITAVFQNADQRALDRLVPESGNVNIYVEGQYSYSLAANDFYDLIKDNAQTTKTVSYQILDVRTQGTEAKVEALHTFTDPWGQTQSVYHTYLLSLGSRGAQIIEYGTSSTRPW